MTMDKINCTCPDDEVEPHPEYGNICIACGKPIRKQEKTMVEKIEKIVIESCEGRRSLLYELDKPDYVKITLVINKTNVTLYEGDKFKNSVP